MGTFRDYISRFMQGRYGSYGIDRLTKFLMGFWFVLLTISIFWPSRAFVTVSLFLFVILYFRLFSRNIPRRYHENEVYVQYAGKVRSFLSRIGGSVKHAQTHGAQLRHYHIYKCPSCGQKIRIPRGKGNIVIRCPKCQKEFRKVS